MRFRIVGVDGNPLDSSTLGFAVDVARGGSGEVRLELSSRQRGPRPPAVTAIRYTSRSLTLTAYRTGSITVDEFRARVATVFVPGQHRLEAETSDGQRVEAVAVVERIAWHERSDDEIRIDVQLQDVAWRSVWPETATAPGAVTVSGNLPSYPVIEIPTSEATPATWRRYAVSDRFGEGLAGYPVKLPYSPIAARTVVLVNGLAVPFLVAGGGLWVRVDVPPGGTTLVDVVTSSAISNDETANKLDLGGLSPASSNTTWTYTSIRAVDAPLAATGTWRLTRTYAHSGERGYRFGGVQRGNGVHLALVSREAPLEGSSVPNLLDDYDSVALVTGVPIASVSLHWSVRARAWEREAFAWSDGYGVAVLRYRRHGDPEWHDVRRMPVVCSWTPGYWVLRYRPYSWWWVHRWYHYLTSSYWYGYLVAEWRYIKTTPYPAIIELRPHRYVIVYRVFVTHFPREGFAPPFTVVDTTGVSVPVAAAFPSDRVVSVAVGLEPYWVRSKLLKVYRLQEYDENGNVKERWQYERYGDSWVEVELGSATVTLDAGSVPAIALVHERNAYVYDGFLRNDRTQQEIGLSRVVADGPLVLDCDRRVVVVRNGELFAAWRLTFSDPVDWLRLEPGTNALVGLEASVRWQTRWLR